MAYKNVKRGWYKLINLDKYLRPLDNYMKSFNESAGAIEYKSSLELRAFRYCDANKHIARWGSESFHVKYLKPTDGKIHRYFIDLFIEFSTGDKFIVEIKPKSETKPPRKPNKKTEKALRNYQNKLMTYYINQAKWNAAKEFANQKDMKFIILTEEELG